MPCALLVLVILSSAAMVSLHADDTLPLSFEKLAQLLQEADTGSSPPAKAFFSGEGQSELRLLSLAMIKLYQEFISSQQHNVCVFFPSCSHFGQEAVQRFGFWKGLLMTADRLQRCNTFASQYGYSIDETTGRLKDPVLSDDTPGSEPDAERGPP